MTPARGRHLGDGGQAFRHVRKLPASGRGQVVRQLASNLRRDVTHGCKHGDAPCLISVWRRRAES
eukprot:5594559-Heterocapsa_arctica.AAC.1